MCVKQICMHKWLKILQSALMVCCLNFNLKYLPTSLDHQVHSQQGEERESGESERLQQSNKAAYGSLEC